MWNANSLAKLPPLPNVISMFCLFELFDFSRSPHLVRPRCHIRCALYSLRAKSFLQELGNMQSMKWWLLLSVMPNVMSNLSVCNDQPSKPSACIESVTEILNGNSQDPFEALRLLEKNLLEAQFTSTLSLLVRNVLVFLLKPETPFKGLEIHASDTQATSNLAPTNSRVSVQLPRELNAAPVNTIAFCLLSSLEGNGNIFGTSGRLYEGRIIGLSVRGKSVSGLQQRVNITINVTTGIDETQNPMCVFLNFSTNASSSNGCLTLWERGQSHITCSCNHLTYFGVLMVSASLSSKDEDILTYISLIGCSLSLLALVCTVFLFITNKNLRKDVTMKVHINLAIALILLNLHFLPSQAIAALSSNDLCLYVGLCLHYFLLASFSWMTLEGFHLYLLLVRVFNIYIKRYLLKLSVVGWGIPAVIVSLVVIIDRDAYGPVFLDPLDSNSTTICYIVNDTVKVVTTIGIFGLVFLFNVSLLGVTVRNIMCLRRHHSKESDCDRMKREICTLLGILTLLGITWGLVFFSFGKLTTPGLYLFCILNSLQGVFVFVWFLMSLRKKRDSATQASSDIRSNNS